VIRIAGPSLPYDPTYHLLWRVDKVRRIVRREKPDVLEVHSPYVAAVSALAAPRSTFGIRTFVWHADFIDTYVREILRARLPRAQAWEAAPDALVAPLWAWVRTIARACDATLVAARWQLDKLVAHGVPRVVHVPFGVDRATFHPSEPRAVGPEEPRRLVAVGRFAVEKRWDVLLDAYERVRRAYAREARGGAVSLAIYGDGPEKGAIAARTRAWPEVTLYGFEKDRARLAHALAHADLFVHACPFETFGLSVAEALACGTPAVVPDRGGAAEMVEPEWGAQYAAADAAACAEAILATLARLDAGENARAAMRAAARRAAERLPTPEEYVRRLFDLYEELLACSPRARGL
jgi:alpha-1,6-mannosyltransferase